MKNFISYICFFFLNVIILHGQSEVKTGLVGRWAAGSPNAFTIDSNIVYSANGGILQIIDLSDPYNPTLLGQIATDGVIYDIAKEGQYVYLAEKGNGLKIIDVSNSANPIQVSEILLPGSTNKLIVNSQTLYVAEGGYIDGPWSGGLRIIDVSDPVNPNLLGYYNSTKSVQFISLVGNYIYMDKSIVKTLIIDVSDLNNPTLIDSVNSRFGNAVLAGAFLYVVSRSDFEGLKIFDVSNPASPTLVSHTTFRGGVKDVAVSGNYVFITSGNFYVGNTRIEGELRVLDIIDPTNPTEIGLYSILGNVSKISISNNVLIISEGVDRSTGNFNKDVGLRIMDVKNPALPELIGFYGIPGGSHDVVIRDDYAFILTSYGGISIVDIHNISNPTQIGFYNSPGSPMDILLKGDFAYLADGNRGLRIVDISDLTNPVEVGSYENGESFYKIDIDGNYAYVLFYKRSYFSSNSSKNVSVYDISNPNNIFEVSILSTNFPTSSILVHGNYAYVGENYSDHWGGSGYIEIFDISNPLNPFLVGYYYAGYIEWSDIFNPTDLELDDKYLYIANNDGYFDILDVSDPTNPIMISSIYARTNNIEIYKNYAFLSESSAGISIFEISDPYAPELVGSYNPSPYIYNLTISDGEIFAAAGKNGMLIFHNELITDVEEETKTLPTNFSLKQNYPNPFNPTTIISYTIPQTNGLASQNVKLIVFDVLGREVATLVNKVQIAGYYEIEFDASASSATASNLNSGVYFYKLSTEKFNSVKKCCCSNKVPPCGIFILAQSRFRGCS